MVLVSLSSYLEFGFALLCATMGLGKASLSLVDSFPIAFFRFRTSSFISKLSSLGQDV